MTEGLNTKQKEAVSCTQGPLLILAGAGSGKTRVLTYRIAHLIADLKVEPYNIMAITFTNKAAGEMRERVDRIVGQVVGERSSEVWVSTFHSTCVRILRRYIDRLGYDNNFTIYDTDDQKTLVKNIIKSLNIDAKSLKEKSVMKVISSCKDELVTWEEYEKLAAGYQEQLIAKVYREYQTQLHKNNALDFDDLIMKTVQLFESQPDVLSYYQDRFQYIMVDEYQDTNGAQFRLVELLAGKHHNICVVGDDDQSIYKFRGANIENILSFEKVYKGTQVVKLEQNYRSTGNILNAANAVIRHNKGRKAKTLWTDREDGEKVVLTQYQTAQEEADGVIRDISRVCAKGNYSDAAVLYRTNAQSRLLEERCVTLGVPYQLIGGVNFYQRKEIKDILCYLKTIANGRDDIAVKRIINVPKRGIGQTTIGRIEQAAIEKGISFYDECKAQHHAKVESFVALIEDFRKKLEDKTAISDMIESILSDTGYAEELEEEGVEEAAARIENIGELVSKAMEYEDLDTFLEEVALVADVDRMDEDASRVRLMTLHAAKGLEFPYVYLTGLEEGLFPSSMSIDSDDKSELEEERRLCYVGITRAMERLKISFARTRMIHGETMYSKASRFIQEIPDEYLEKHLLYDGRSFVSDDDDEDDGYEYDRSFRNRRPERNSTYSGYGSDRGNGYTGVGNIFRDGAPSKPAVKGFSRPEPKPAFGKAVPVSKAEHLDYGPGDRVRHIKFGEGTVREIKDGTRDYEVTVEFDKAGERTLLAGFAKLEKL